MFMVILEMDHSSPHLKNIYFSAIFPLLSPTKEMYKRLEQNEGE